MCECGAERKISYGTDREAVLPEIEEMAVAAELLGATREAALDRVLASAIADAVRQSGGSLPAATGRILLGIVKSIVRRVLPMVGQMPTLRRGSDGRALPAGAGRLLGVELEGLSPEDMELAAARRSVRFARSAAQRAARAPRRLPPGLAARRAAVAAARRWAPGLLSPSPVSATAVAGSQPSFSGQPASSAQLASSLPPLERDHRRRGPWVRRGNNVVVIC